MIFCTPHGILEAEDHNPKSPRLIQAKTETEVSDFGVWILYLGWWFQIFIRYFHPYFGEDEPILNHIFQMGGSTTN